MRAPGVEDARAPAEVVAAGLREQAGDGNAAPAVAVTIGRPSGRAGDARCG